MSNSELFLTVENGVLTKCDKEVTDIVIHDGVTKIGDSAFSGCANLKLIVISEGVTEIGWSAFSGCASLESITIPDSVTGIGEAAFMNCTSLTSITIPDSVKYIGNSAFAGCTSLREIIVGENNADFISADGVLYSKNKDEIIRYPAGKDETSFEIPDCVTKIGWSAFDGCASLESITLPNGVTEICVGAFKNCKNLKALTIPDSVTTIGCAAFMGCESLESITIPAGVTEIVNSFYRNRFGASYKDIDVNFFDGEHVFCNCKNLREINVAEDNPNYFSKDGVLYNKKAGTMLYDRNKESLMCYPMGKSDLSFKVPDSVWKIEPEAFQNCDNLQSVTLPDGWESIGEKAFKDCKGLEEIRIPQSVSTIELGAFMNCTHLKYVNGIRNVGGIGRQAFMGCTSLEEIKLLDNAIVSLEEVVRPEGVETKITYLGDVDPRIEAYAFEGCANLKQINIPYGTRFIGESAFENCTKLARIDIPGTVGTIEKNAFRSCTSLSSVKLNDGIEAIFAHAFDGCKSLTSIKIPASVNNISDCAFQCSGLQEAIISKRPWRELGSSIFWDCVNLNYIKFSDDTPIISGADGPAYMQFHTKYPSYHRESRSGLEKWAQENDAIVIKD